MKKKIKFPKDFLWGSGTSAYQVEGNIKNSWTKWEQENAKRLADEAEGKWKKWQKEKFPEMFDEKNYISGKACDHYNRYDDDFDIAKELGHNAHRFSIEWSRIEPEEGKFNQEEIEHYRDVLKSLRNRDIEPFITLWHWTEPAWLGEVGGWKNKKSQEYFIRFVEKIVSEYKDLVKFWVVVNEPNVGIGFGYFLGSQPPGKRGPVNFLRAYFNLLKVYKKTYSIIHKIDDDAKVGFAHSFAPYESNIIWPIGKLIIFIGEYCSKYFVRKTNGYFDFIGCNYYRRHDISLNKNNFKEGEVDDLNWGIYPKGIYKTLMRTKKYNVPVYITENGIADADDSRREKFIKSHLYWIHKAISEGVDVRGYLHWSLLDNYEFPDTRGFWPRFGLVEINYRTLERKIRPSAYEYAKICRDGEFFIDDGEF